MARELQDVLHYFLPDPVPDAVDAPAVHRVSVLVAPRDLVRLALSWNLAVEAARQGARVALVAPQSTRRCAPWPRGGPRSLGVEVTEVESDQLAALGAASDRAALRLATRPGGPALVLTAVPAARLCAGADAGALLDHVLLLTRPDERELVETWAALGAISAQAPRARIGVSVFGVASLGDARRAFEGLAALAELELARPLSSYGVLIDDVQLSRSIVSQRPIALSQPTSPAARALADVAAMLLEDAERRAEPLPA
jgi:hypothetical protein